MILIELNGERQLIDPATIGGYDGAVIINPDVPDQPGDFHILDATGNWVHDQTLEDERLHAQAMADKDALIAELQARLAEVEATMMVMVPLVEAASGVSVATGEPL